MAVKQTYECDHCHGSFGTPDALKRYGSLDICARCFGNFTIAEDKVMTEIESGKRPSQLKGNLTELKKQIAGSEEQSAVLTSQISKKEHDLKSLTTAFTETSERIRVQSEDLEKRLRLAEGNIARAEEHLAERKKALADVEEQIRILSTSPKTKN